MNLHEKLDWVAFCGPRRAGGFGVGCGGEVILLWTRLHSVFTPWAKESVGWEPLAVPLPHHPLSLGCSWGRGERPLCTNCPEWSLPGAGRVSFLTKPHQDGPTPLVGVHDALWGWRGKVMGWMGKASLGLLSLPLPCRSWVQVPPTLAPTCVS